jgi:cysteine desulfurase
MISRKVYLDNNATTPLHPEVKKEMVKAMDVFGNPSSLHQFGRSANAMVKEAREAVASFIGGSPEEIIFTGSGSEANNTVLSILAYPSKQCNCSGVGKYHKIITTVIEHPCILETAKCLSDRNVEVKYLSVDHYGKVSMEELEEELKKSPALVSIMMANNEIGTIQDIKQIAHFAHQYGSLIHTDAVQAVGKIPVDVNDLRVDFLSLSGHKVYGPKGIGALYVRKGTPFCPLIRGGHQENGRRAGTENTLGIIGFGKAIQMRAEEMIAEHEKLLGFKKILKEGLKSKIENIQFNGHPQDCLANTLNVSFPGAEGESILLYLDLAGIAVSTGSACASGSLDPSHVLLAIGMPIEYAHGSIRISMGRNTIKEDIEYMIEVFPTVIKRIRSMSTMNVKGERHEQ